MLAYQRVSEQACTHGVSIASCGSGLARDQPWLWGTRCQGRFHQQYLIPISLQDVNQRHPGEGRVLLSLLSNPTPPAGPVYLKKINDLQNVFLREFRNSGHATYPHPNPLPEGEGDFFLMARAVVIFENINRLRVS
ncbi:MAG: hypothetical protein Q4G70_16440 [Pseudomonadota bacterium]|nr:hypothetical protein [Pseudomonadota bacterium]